ncbi:MAG: polysaccharide deacetylase [Lachnospiraceae bacterium]|nr:polysaccharide deacetylase [Lachnospiraceae bacterium]
MDPARRKRINLYKKIIIAVVLMSILIPLVLCVVLLCQVCSLKNEIESLDAFQSSVFAEIQNGDYIGQDEQQPQPEGSTSTDSVLLADNGQNEQNRAHVQDNKDKSQSSVIETPPYVPEETKSDNFAEIADTKSDNFAEIADTKSDNFAEIADTITPEETTTEEITTEETTSEDTTPVDTRKKVYLTFDDGPSSNTNAILDILKEYNAKATFFVNAKNSSLYADEYKRIVEEGHTLALHSYTHVYEDVYASVDAFMADTHKLIDYLYELTGVKCNIYRFPGGSSNKKTKIDIKEFGKALDAEGIVYFDWNVSSGDAVYPALSADEIYTNVTSGVVKKNTPVVLMHDLKSKATTVEALPRILQFLIDKDYNIAAIDSSTELVQHRKID